MPSRSIVKLLQQLKALGEHAIQGNLVEVMLTCGTPTCGCHQDRNRRHGPHLYLRYRDLNGRSRSKPKCSATVRLGLREAHGGRRGDCVSLGEQRSSHRASSGSAAAFPRCPGKADEQLPHRAAQADQSHQRDRHNREAGDQAGTLDGPSRVAGPPRPQCFW